MLNIYNNFFFYVVVILLTGYMKERQKMEDLDNNNLNQAVVQRFFCENKGLGGGCSVSRARETWSREMLLKVMLHGSIRNDDF